MQSQIKDEANNYSAIPSLSRQHYIPVHQFVSPFLIPGPCGISGDEIFTRQVNGKGTIFLLPVVTPPANYCLLHSPLSPQICLKHFTRNF